MSDTELRNALKSLDGWQPWSERVLREYPFERVELRRSFGFKTFKAAIKFMAEATKNFSERQRHPRWGNE